MNFNLLKNNCLKHGFKLETNLSQVSGAGFNLLIEALNMCSVSKSNMRIIERIMYYHNCVFRNPESIKEIMRKNEPVINAFATLGNCDMRCNIRWLIDTLNNLEEFLPLKEIVATAPPVIIFLGSTKQIKPGGKIEFRVRTISEAKMQWWKHNDGKAEIIVDHIRVNEYSCRTVCYQSKSSDKGYFYLDVSCSGGYRKQSPWIFVGNDEVSTQDMDNYKSSNYNETISLDSTNETTTMNIVPSRESDGIKRVALLIGIMNYKSHNNNFENLRAPETDILDLERVLLQMGFTVFCFGELNETEIRKILQIFSNTCIESNCYVFCYFAGHGNSFNKVDYLQLTKGKISVPDVLNILIMKKPKLLVALFDMCRSDNNEVNVNSKLPEANIPIGKNLILIMSTLPRKEAYEQSLGPESRSLIMKPLCDNLSEYGCKRPITMVLSNFLISCENICQVPTMTGIGIQDAIGIEILIPRIQSKFQWLKVPENQKVMSYFTIDMKTFHNFLNLFVDIKQDPSIAKMIIEIENEIVDFTKPSNLFRYRSALKDKNSININFSLVQESTTMIKSTYPIEVTIPEILIPFLRL